MAENELEQYADEVAQRVFEPLYKNDLFWLDHLEQSGNQLAYYAYLYELIDTWTVPDETQRMVEYDIEKYCPRPENAHERERD